MVWVVKPEGCGLAWPVGLAAVTKSHKDLNSLDQVEICFLNVWQFELSFPPKILPPSLGAVFKGRG